MTLNIESNSVANHYNANANKRRQRERTKESNFILFDFTKSSFRTVIVYIRFYYGLLFRIDLYFLVFASRSSI